jgi:hypothetical protein
MNYKLVFPSNIGDPRLQRMKRELETQFESWKLRYRLGLTKEVLHTEILKWTLEMGYLPKGQTDVSRTVGVNLTATVLNPWVQKKVPTPFPHPPSLPLPLAPSEVIQPPVVLAPAKPAGLQLTITFVVDSPATDFLYCPGCGIPRVPDAQKVHSHSIVPASMWPVIVIEAMKALPAKKATTTTDGRVMMPELPLIDPDTFGTLEKQITGEIAKIGLSTSGVGADDEHSSLCLDCETLHSNMSLLQRHAAAHIEVDPDRKFKLVGLQFGARKSVDPLTPPHIGREEDLIQFTVRQLGRVAARIDHEMRLELPKHFSKQTTLGPGAKPLKDAPLDARLLEMKGLGQQTRMVPLLERLLFDIDAFIAQIKKQGLEVCKRKLPNDFSAYSSKYSLTL